MLLGTHLTLLHRSGNSRAWWDLASLGHDSAGDLKTLIQSAMGGIRKEVDGSKTYIPGDNEQDLDQTYYQSTQVQNLPGWWVQKIWHSYDGWLLVAKKDEFNLLVFDPPRQLDQRNLVEETISSEGSMECQRQSMAANISKRAHQTFLHLPEDALSSRTRSRSPRGERGYVAAAGAGITSPSGPLNPIDQDGEATMPLAMQGWKYILPLPCR